MNHPVLGIDHCYLMVRDLDRSLDQFRRLGFTVSPRGLHSANRGTANHTIMLSADDYFELLGVVAQTPENAARRKTLERDGEGLYAMACRIGDAHAAKQQLAQLGVATSDVNTFERPLDLPDGTQGVAAFSVVQFLPEEVPQGIAFMCEHHTRDMVWLPELMTHANGAKALAGAVAVSPDPKTAAEHYARLFAAGSVSQIPGGWQTDTGSVPIAFLTSEEAIKRYKGLDLSLTPSTAFSVLQIAVDSLDIANDVLAANAIDMHATACGIAVDPSVASGAVIEFVAQ